MVLVGFVEYMYCGRALSILGAESENENSVKERCEE